MADVLAGQCRYPIAVIQVHVYARLVRELVFEFDEQSRQSGVEMGCRSREATRNGFAAVDLASSC